MRIVRAGLKRYVLLALLFAAVVCGNAAALRLHPDNPRYFLFRERPAVLITSGEHYGAVLNLEFDFIAYLDELARHGFNHTRLFSGTYRELPGSFNIIGNTLAPAPGKYVCPWARSREPGCLDGGNKFDLKRWDTDYFARLKRFVREAGARDIVVEINLFCTMYSDDLWKASPMNAANNINGIGNVARGEVYALKESALTEAQLAVARKIVKELNAFDNVYYEVCNEPYERGGMHPDWQNRIVAAVLDAERSLPDDHLVSINHPHGRIPTNAVNPAVSIYNFHAAKPEFVTSNYHLNKAIGDNETGGSARDDTTYRKEGWEFLMAGGAIFSHLDFSFATAHPRGTFLDHKAPGGGSPALRRQLAVLKRFVEGFDFVRMRPDPNVVTAGVPPKGRAHALAQPGVAYAIYITGNGPAELQIALPNGHYRAEWVRPLDGAIAGAQSFEHRGGSKGLQSPAFREDIALSIRAEK
jgi:hypothetical protein